MNLRNFLMGIGAAAFVSVAAMAVDPAIKAGAAVVDPTGGAVGTIDAVNGDLVVVNTGSNRVNVPASSFGIGETGLVISLTRAELDAAADQAKAKAQADLKAMLVPGAVIHGSDGLTLGTIESVDVSHVTLALPEGQKAKLPIAAVAQGDKGLTIAMTSTQLKQAVGPAQPDPKAPK